LVLGHGANVVTDHQSIGERSDAITVGVSESVAELFADGAHVARDQTGLHQGAMGSARAAEHVELVEARPMFGYHSVNQSSSSSPRLVHIDKRIMLAKRVDESFRMLGWQGSVPFYQAVVLRASNQRGVSFIDGKRV
jgi:hypothetical protein